MNIKESAHRLNELLKHDSNFQVVGIRENNIAAFILNPERFIREITEDSLICYTFNQPTKRELELTSWEGLKVEWKMMGEMVML